MHVLPSNILLVAMGHVEPCLGDTLCDGCNGVKVHTHHHHHHHHQHTLGVSSNPSRCTSSPRAESKAVTQESTEQTGCCCASMAAAGLVEPCGGGCAAMVLLLCSGVVERGRKAVMREWVGDDLWGGMVEWCCCCSGGASDSSMLCCALCWCLCNLIVCVIKMF